MRFLVFTVLVAAFLLAACQNTIDNGEITIEQINKKLEEKPHDLQLLEQRTNLYIKDKQISKAITDLEHCINLAPDSIRYLLEVADLYMQNGKVNSTLQYLQKATALDPQNTDLWVKVGEIYLIFKKYPDVVKFANKAITTDPYNYKAYFLKAFAFKEAGDTNNAILNFQQSLKNNPDYFDANMELGAIYSAKKNPLAEIYFERAIAQKPNDINANYLLAWYYQNNDFLNEAISTYKHIIEMDSSFAESYFNIGYIYLEILKVNDMAVPYFTKAIDAKPEYKEAYYNRALAYEEVGNVMQAELDYQSAIKIDPDYVVAILGLKRVKTTINE